jgi:anaerobic magnesium-protoporphyrin IX monomethyl ester cyclase
MADLLLTHGYFLYEDPKELKIMKPYVPLGILYICSHLRKKGFDVDVFDSTFSSPQELIRHLQTEPPSVLGVYANLMTRKRVVEIVKVAREAGWKTIVGGPEPGAYLREYLEAGADVVVIGEGEITIEELLPALKETSEAALEKVSGIAFLTEDGHVRQTASRPQITDLDAQPWPARGAIDVTRYVRTWREAHGQGSLSFITARGCPYRCRWCSHQVFGMTHRRRKPQAVVDEVEWLLAAYHPDMVWIADDVFTIHHGWLRQYTAEMRRRGLRIPFECISRADRLNDEVVDLLAELGCFRVWIGSESGSQRILNAMERGVTIEQVQSAVAGCKTRGIQTGMFLMWGYEGEELQDIEATIDHVKRSDPDIFFTTVAYPIKGTPYYQRVADSLVQLKPWSETSDRELTLRNHRPARFYEFADRLLRDEVQLARLQRRAVEDSATSTSVAEQELRMRIEMAREGLYSTSAQAVEA